MVVISQISSNRKYCCPTAVKSCETTELDISSINVLESSALHATYNYLRYTMHLSNLQIAEWPLCLRFSIGAIRRRHEFLVQLHKADYNEGSANYVHVSSLLQPSDRKFALNVAHTYLNVYNAFLKNY